MSGPHAGNEGASGPSPELPSRSGDWPHAPSSSPPIPHLFEVSSPPVYERRLTLRRREARIRPVEDRIWIEWWEEGDMLGRSATLVNVSRHGAMFVTSAMLRSDHRIRIYLEEPAPQIGVRATVLQVVHGLHGVHQVRLEFDTPCPDAFLEAAAHGFEAWLQRTPTYSSAV